MFRRCEGCKYESIGKEVGGDRKAFEEWRGAGKNAVKDLLIKVGGCSGGVQVKHPSFQSFQATIQLPSVNIFN